MSPFTVGYFMEELSFSFNFKELKAKEANVAGGFHSKQRNLRMHQT